MVKQALHQSLQQKLLPQQIQLMKLIELSTLELEQKVKDELETNPALDDENVSADNLEDNFSESMKTSDILLTWNLPTNNLSKIAPNLKWIHCIGAGVEHLSPFDWLPSKVILTNNKGVHRKKAGEFGLMSILMLQNHFQKKVMM